MFVQFIKYSRLQFISFALFLCFMGFAQNSPPYVVVGGQNWRSSIGYDLSGRPLSGSVGYFDGLGNPIQQQTWDVLTGKIWASETKYDAHGRGVFQTLSAPIGSSRFYYRSNFVRQSNGAVYGLSSFDSNPESPQGVGSHQYSLGWYYSSGNSSEPYQDITSYPFSRTVYSRLRPGEVQKVLGGNKVNGQWRQGYSFTLPLAQELFYVFGKSYFPQRSLILGAYQTVPISHLPGGYHVYTLQSCLDGSRISNVRLTTSNRELIPHKVYRIRMVGTPHQTKYFKVTHKEWRHDFGDCDNIKDCIERESKPPPTPTFQYGSLEELRAYSGCPEGRPSYIEGSKTVVRDVHGVETVVFKDQGGQVLATARSGNKAGSPAKSYKVVSPIGELGYVDIHLPQGCGGTVRFLGKTGARFKIYDLISEKVVPGKYSVSGQTHLNPGFYRVELLNADQYQPNHPHVRIQNNSITLINKTVNVGVEYRVNYYDYSLNYYDRSGRLKTTTQPLGFNASSLLGISEGVVSHKMSSDFSYNSLGQLLETKSPDEGKARFKYRKDGQIRFSQNAEQTKQNSFSYTNYDAQGRPVESGVAVGNYEGLDPDVASFSGTRSQQHFTVYDIADTASIKAFQDAGVLSKRYQRQKYVAGNVSKTYTQNPKTTTTWYSYDVYGRVEWMLQKIEGLSGIKTIDYDYDDTALGQVSKVHYQRYNTNERFTHHYSYNISGQLIKVETSSNGSDLTPQAAYSYYETGALKRTELAGGIQGLDYVYNLNGQLKNINHPQLSASKDPGKDANDLFGLSLNYHNNDYARPLSNVQRTSKGVDQYNGNIKNMAWNTRQSITQTPKTLSYSYRYNTNNWLTEATLYSEGSGGSTGAKDHEVLSTLEKKSRTVEATKSITLKPGFSTAPGISFTAKIGKGQTEPELMPTDYQVSGITYDANGNIKTLKRNKNTEGGNNKMDDFSYSYNSNSNQLNHIRDAVTQSTNADDLKSQPAGNYVYNSIGQLIENRSEKIKYSYTASGLVREIKRNNVPLLKLFYNDRGHRVRKEVYVNNSLTQTEHYVRDASGSVLSIYRNGVQTELPIYGASRLGVFYKKSNSSVYQLTDHLGNVRASFKVSNHKTLLDNDFSYGSTGQWYKPGNGGSINASEQKLKISLLGKWTSTGQYFTVTPNVPIHISFDFERGTMVSPVFFVRERINGVWEPGNKRDFIYNIKTGHHKLSMTPKGNYIQIYFEKGNSSDDGTLTSCYVDNFMMTSGSPAVAGQTDYYPFGMPMPNRNIEGNYRYGYQGEFAEKEKELGNGINSFELRLWDSRIGRWLTTDPKKAGVSPYWGMNNNPINIIDPDGGKGDDWYKDADGNYVYDSRINSQQDLATFGIEGTYVGETFSDFNAGQIGDVNGNLFSMDGSLITSFLDGVEISNLTYFDIYRDTQTSNSTTGTFTFGDVTGYTLERPGPDTTTPNMRLRIPAGVYNVSLHNGTSYKNVLKLSNDLVSASRAILIHNGNYPESTDGCILVGCSRSKDFVGSSVKKLNEIRATFKDIDIKNIRVRVHNNFPHRGIPFLD